MTRQNAVIQCEFCARILGELEGLILLGIIQKQFANRARSRLASARIAPFNEKVASKRAISSKNGAKGADFYCYQDGEKRQIQVSARSDTVASYTSESDEHTDAALESIYGLW